MLVMMTSSETMMDLSCSNKSRDCNENLQEERKGHNLPQTIECKPKDLTVRTNMRRAKPIPPPLNLKSEFYPEQPMGFSTALKEFAILATGPQSPLMQKNLPFRKRAHSVPDAQNAPYSAPPTMLNFFPQMFKQEPSQEDEKDSDPPLNLSLPPTPKSFRSHEAGSPSGSSTVSSSTLSEAPTNLLANSSYPSSPHPSLSNALMDPQFLSMGQQSFARHHMPPWNPFLPTAPIMTSHWLNSSTSALLSPAPSSLGSSQEDLRMGATHSIPFSSMSNLVYESDPWRLPWPYPVWHCFQLGTVIRFSMSNLDIVLRAEEVSHRSELQFITPERLGPLSVQYIKPLDTKSGAAEITFSCTLLNVSGDIKLIATCYSYHTFLVMDKGWCAVSPESVLRQYGIQCQPLECGDSCAVPKKIPSISSPGICEKFKRFSFSPEELSSPVAPSGSLLLSPPNTPTMKTHMQMQQPQQSAPHSSKQSKSAKQKANKAQQSGEKPPKSAKAPLDPDRPKRPMNAFMLFAKQHRLNLIRLHPGKDNRFVSVILGEAWRQLPPDEKEVFITEAKALSHERKRLHPECWKRKRAQSTT